MTVHMMNQRAYTSIAAIAIVLGLMLCAAPHRVLADDPPAIHQSAIPADQIPPYLTDAINSPARPAADRESDTSRQPAQVMAFFGIKPGMQVADLWAGGGSTTELLARIVGPSGKVYSQNTAFPEKFKKNEAAWQARLKEPGMGNVVEVTKPFGAPDMIPVPPNTLDVVLINLNYHDLFDVGADPEKFNAIVFKALKPGGVYGIVDNSAQAGSGTRDTDTLHRIDEDFVIKQIHKAGFRLVAFSDVLSNPKDPRTEPFWKMDHMQDRFILKFVKPITLAGSAH
ncbi:MAG: class I SAM-dependent methyltransferase [Deltaproteobacteria bacterium]|nr:class I SAM-dependent methyltransferase [Deltaproteobacteria bacterium]